MTFRVRGIIFLLFVFLKFTSFQDTPGPGTGMTVLSDGTGLSASGLNRLSILLHGSIIQLKPKPRAIGDGDPAVFNTGDVLYS